MVGPSTNHFLTTFWVPIHNEKIAKRKKKKEKREKKRKKKKKTPKKEKTQKRKTPHSAQAPPAHYAQSHTDKEDPDTHVVS